MTITGCQCCGPNQICEYQPKPMTEVLKQHRENRKAAKKKLGKYGSLEVTHRRFDCGINHEGLFNACEECKVCHYNRCEEKAAMIGVGFQSESFFEEYFKMVYRNN